jgi:hypothetical protein
MYVKAIGRLSYLVLYLIFWHMFFGTKSKGREVTDDSSWMWHGSLAWDSMTIHEGLVFDPHTIQLVGFGKDALEPNVILSESNRLG